MTDSTRQQASLEQERAPRQEFSPPATQADLDRANALEAKVKKFEETAQMEAWKNEVSAETGIPANVLAGSSKAELEEHADKLKALVPTTPGRYRAEGPSPALPLVRLDCKASCA